MHVAVKPMRYNYENGGRFFDEHKDLIPGVARQERGEPTLVSVGQIGYRTVALSLPLYGRGCAGTARVELSSHPRLSPTA